MVDGAAVTKKTMEVLWENPQFIEGRNLARAVQEVAEATWSMPEQGKMINGRWFTQHALERMAPDTFLVRAILEKRALNAGYPRGTPDFLKYVNPRGIPPMVVEDAIQHGIRSLGKEMGTLDFETKCIKVSINEITGAVITIRPK